MIADSTQEHNVGLVQERTCPAPARLGSSEHKNTENQLKRVSSLKNFPPAAGQPAALRATLFTKKHIHSLHLSGARPHEILAGAEYQSEEQADAGAGMGARG